jgi:hypothetical protein
MKPKLHFLCRFMKRTDNCGRIYFTGTLGNSRLLLYPTAEGDMRLFLGPQLFPENKSLQDDRRRTKDNALDLEAVANLK